MKSIAKDSSAIFANLFKNYFRVCKNMVAFYSTVQKCYWLFCVGVLNSRQWVDFEVESVFCNPRERKWNFVYS